jgi:hypothetical protein
METAIHIFTNTNNHGRRLKVFAMRHSLLVKLFKRNATSLAGTVFAYAPMVVRNRPKAEVKKAYAIVKAMQGAKSEAQTYCCFCLFTSATIFLILDGNFRLPFSRRRKIFWAILTSLPTHDTRVMPVSNN